MSKARLCLIVTVALGLSSVGALRGQEAGALGAQEAGSRIVTAIKQASSHEEFEAKLQDIQGVTEQQLLEGRLLWAYVSQDPDYYDTFAAKLAPDQWKSEEAFYLKQPEQLGSIVHFLAAIRARAAGDLKTFESEVKESVWLDPENQRALEAIKSHCKQVRQDRVRVPMDVKVFTSDGDKSVTFAELVKDQKALYIQVWSSWCGPCIKLLPELTARGKSLPPQGVAVVGMNSEMNDEYPGGSKRKAEKIRQDHSMQLPWLVEPEEEPFRKLLEIDSVPRAILVAPDGKVLFNGHPLDVELTEALKKLDVELPKPSND